MNSTALPALYLAQWYNGKETSTYNEKFLNNLVSIRLGPPRLRMLRTSEGEQTLLSLSRSSLLSHSLAILSPLSRSSHISMTPFILPSLSRSFSSHTISIFSSLSACLLSPLFLSCSSLSHSLSLFSPVSLQSSTNLTLSHTLLSSLSQSRYSLPSLPPPLYLFRVQPMVISLSVSLSSSTNGSLSL